MHFPFLVHNCSFFYLTKIKKKKTFEISFSNKTQQMVTKIQFEIYNLKIKSTMFFHFENVAALFDSKIKSLISHPVCIFIYLFKAAENKVHCFLIFMICDAKELPQFESKKTITK